MVRSALTIIQFFGTKTPLNQTDHLILSLAKWSQLFIRLFIH